MGNRYREEKPFAFFDPEEDWESQRPAPPRHRSAPVSPRAPISSRAPISPRAQPPGHYPPEPDYGYNNRSGPPGSPRERPFGHYDPEVDERESPRQGMGPPSRPLDAEPGYYGASQPRPNELDSSSSRGVGRGAAPPPYDKSDSFDHLSIPQGAPPNSSYARGAPEPGYAGSGGSGTGRGGGGYGDPANGKRPTYGDGDSGYGRAVGGGRSMGRGTGMGGGTGMGDGRYVYGGFQLPVRLDMEQEEEYGAPPPAPISSENAHMVYASVFSDPVYGGARQLNARKGYQEEPPSLQEAHHREDALRHPDQY